MDDFDKTIAPRREHISSGADDVTMPGKRDRKPDGRFSVGDLIMNRYKVLAELGQGGMGVVYKCFDETAGIEIALKALPPELSHNTLEMEDIKDNFQLVHNLHHPNIASSNNLERDNSNGNYYLIMECCEGEDLRRWLKRKRKECELKLEEVLPIIEQVASALDYATDAALRKALKETGENQIIFIVSQRAASIMHADKIIVLDEGEMVGIGTHKELLDNCRIYREIYDSQFSDIQGGGENE